MVKYKDFCIFIFSHNRADDVVTYRLLKRLNCSYPIYLIIDNEDSQIKTYFKNFGKENVFVFNKQVYFDKADTMDNFNIKSAIIYARNYSYDLARKLNINYFLMLDDDFTSICYRINDKLKHPSHSLIIKNIDNVLNAFITYLIATPFKSIAMSQGGDWFGGKESFGKPPKRKAMNSFFCKANKKIKFKGTYNEDVTAYVADQSKGNLFLTIPHIQISQQPTQSNGGMAEAYKNSGTYIKSFYTILAAPSCVHVNTMGATDRRLHHRINWPTAVPLIISEKHKK